MSSYLNPAPNLEALLRETCRRALGLGVSFTNRVRLYRSIVAMARELRLRLSGPMHDGGNQPLAASLAAVSEDACALGLDPDLPLPDAIMVQRLAVHLSRASRRAAGTANGSRPFSAQDPVNPEKPPQPRTAKASEPEETRFPQQNPVHRDEPEADDRLSAWRYDHTTERDRRAHEKLRTVIDERVISKIRAMNKRDREEREAAQRAAVA